MKHGVAVTCSMVRQCDTFNHMYNHELNLKSSLTGKNLAYVKGIGKNKYQTKFKKNNK